MLTIGLDGQQLVIGRQGVFITRIIKQGSGIALKGFLIPRLQLQGFLITEQGIFVTTEIIIPMLPQITAHHIMSEVTTGLTTVLKHHTGLFLTLLFDQEGCQIIEGGFHMGTREDWLRQEEIAIVLKGVTELTAIGIQTEETVQILQIDTADIGGTTTFFLQHLSHTGLSTLHHLP